MSDGGYLIVWVSIAQDPDGSSGIYAQRYDSSGIALGGETSLHSVAALDQYYPHGAALTDGSYVIAWSGEIAAGQHYSFLRRFLPDGSAVGPEVPLGALASDFYTDIAVAATSDGGYVAYWNVKNIPANSMDLYLQKFKADGTAATPATFITTEHFDGDQYFSNRVTGLPDGGFIITFDRHTAGEYGVYTQRFDAAGTKVGSEVTIATYAEDLNFRSTVHALPHGGHVVMWNDNGFDGSLWGVNQKVFVPSTSDVNGTAAKNTLTGTSGDDRIFGFEGNDTLVGLGGDDLLDGGLGNDKMSGGLGDDVYVVDAKSDRVIDLAGEGTDTVQTALLKYTLGKTIENLTFTDGAAHIGTGNVLDNHLTGGAGNDVLDGKAGADVLEGGLGDDTYYVDNTGDVVIEVVGGGTDRVFATVSYSLSASSEVETLTLKTGKLALNLTGSDTDNVLIGNSNANVLSGMDGSDTLRGGKGRDTLTGGAGVDAFVFETTPSATSNLDTVTDFVSGTDTLVFDQTVFKAFTATGAISAAAFWSGAGVDAAHDADDRIIYDTTSGALWYDADGNGRSKAVQVAVLAGHPDLAFVDILIAA